MDNLSNAFRALFTRPRKPMVVEAALLLLGGVVALILAGAMIARQLSSL